jgi:hypothetical protein
MVIDDWKPAATTNDGFNMPFWWNT